MIGQTGSVEANLDEAVEAEKNPSSSPDFGYIITGTMTDAEATANLDEPVKAKKISKPSPALSYITSGRMTDAEADVLKASLKEAAARPANRVAEGEMSAAEAVTLLTALKKAVEMKKNSNSSHCPQLYHKW